MPRKKLIKNKQVEEKVEPKVLAKVPEFSEKEKLMSLYQALKDLGINSIGDLENRIARL